MTPQPTRLLADEEMSHSIIGAFYAAYNTLGYGFSERVCVAALERELIKRSHRVRREVDTPIYYDGVVIARQRIDMVVDDRIIVEVKVTDHRAPADERQLYNYLCAAKREVGLLLYFTYKPKLRRIYRASRSNPAHPDSS